MLIEEFFYRRGPLQSRVKNHSVKRRYPKNSLSYQIRYGDKQLSNITIKNLVRDGLDGISRSFFSSEKRGSNTTVVIRDSI